jgi:SAM-dependent methyltransferase
LEIQERIDAMTETPRSWSLSATIRRARRVTRPLRRGVMRRLRGLSALVARNSRPEPNAGPAPLMETVLRTSPLRASAGPILPRSASRTPTDAMLDDRALAAVTERYRGRYKVPTLGYGTVRDFCDSMEHMPRFASANRDIKDCQRSWAMKAILGALPGGGKLLEIGAGEPLLADLLRRQGYEIWIVDPYDGSGNGPRDFQLFLQTYPALHFVREPFTSDFKAAPPGSFDCIYSVSVLEHVPIDALASVVGGMKRLLKPDGASIHAIDHVVKGNGADQHLAHLMKTGQLFGFQATEIHDLIRVLGDDADTYYLSAESHNMWRGSRSYDECPMRACVSIQVSVAASRLMG